VNSASPILLAQNAPESELLLEDALRRAALANPVIVVRDSDQTIAYLKGESPFSDRQQFPECRILMLDLSLPRNGGWDVLRWVRSQAEFDELLVVVLTSQTRSQDWEHAYELGANSFLTQPYRVEDLAQLAAAFSKSWFH